LITARNLPVELKSLVSLSFQGFPAASRGRIFSFLKVQQRMTREYQAVPLSEWHAQLVHPSPSSNVAVRDEIEGEIVDHLAALAAEANSGHEECQVGCDLMLGAAWQAGRALNAAKALLKHGEWLPWLAANFHASQPTAHRYMTIAANYSNLNNLPFRSITEALVALNPPKQLQIEHTPRESTPPSTEELAAAPRRSVIVTGARCLTRMTPSSAYNSIASEAAR
jgi:DUF3102 family protein